MNRRLYFLLPDVSHTLSVIDELYESGIKLRVHIKAGAGIERSSLPEVLQDIHHDTEHNVEGIFWNINLFNFFMALLVMIVSFIMDWNTIAMVMIAIMAFTFFMGVIDTTLPDVKLSDFDHALSHKEILLMVDTTRNQVAAIEDIVHWHHPDVVDGGVSWHLGRV